MTKTLYLHVGMPKCASTTIQGVLRTHADVFQDHGKFYGLSSRDNTQGQGNVATLLADMRNRRTKRVRQALSFFLDRDSDVIMSSEMFIGLARTAMAGELISQATDAGFTTRLICYVRRQDHWIESDYKQHIKGGSDWRDGIEALIARRARTRVLNYHWLLKNWSRSLLPEYITVVPLQARQSDLYPLERFLAYLDMDPALAEGLALPRQNISPPVGLIEPMRYLKAGLLDQGVAPEHIPRYLHRFLSEASGRLTVPPRRFLLTLKARQTLLNRYAASNKRLSNDYLGGVPAFDDLVEDEATPQPPLAEEAAAVLGAWVGADPAQFVSATDADMHPASRSRRWIRWRGN